MNKNHYFNIVISLLIGLLLSPSYVVAAEGGQDIESIRASFIQKQARDREIKALANQEKLRRARIAAFQVEEECRKLHIDCDTGKRLPPEKIVASKLTITQKIRLLEEEEKLLEAQAKLQRKKDEYCIAKGLNCDANKKILAKQKADKRLLSSAKSKLIAPPKPALIGFLNQTSLFRVGDGRISAYRTGTIVGGYKIDQIKPGILTTLSHPALSKPIDIYVAD